MAEKYKRGEYVLKQILYGFCVAGISAALVSCNSDDVASAESGVIASSASSVLPGADPASSGAAADTIPAGTSSASVLPSSASVEQSSAAVAVSSSAAVFASSSSAVPAITYSSSSQAFVVPSSSSAAVVPGSSSVIKSSSSVAEISSSSAIVPAEKAIVLEVTNHDDYEKGGPFKTKQITGGAHDGDIIIMPENLTTDPNKIHGVIIWGPGGGTKPDAYGQVTGQLASYGFVVYGTWQSGGSGDEMTAAIDWLEKQNKDPNSVFYQKLKLDKVGVSGHSMGGLNSEQALVKDKRVATAFLCNSGAFGGTGGLDKNTAGKPAGIIYGREGMERPNAEADYANAKGPAWISMMHKDGVEMGHGSGPWEGADAVCAWMRWQIGGDSTIRKDFLENGGKYNNNGIWQTQFKNW